MEPTNCSNSVTVNLSESLTNSLVFFPFSKYKTLGNTSMLYFEVIGHERHLSPLDQRPPSHLQLQKGGSFSNNFYILIHFT